MSSYTLIYSQRRTPADREAIWTRNCAVSFVIFGLNGFVILRRMWQYRRLK